MVQVYYSKKIRFVRFDAVYGKLANGRNGHCVPQHMFPMAYTRRGQDGAYRYDLYFQPAESDMFVYGVGVLPNHTDLPNVYDLLHSA